ncbi:YpmS family protein [Lysinibacillus sp. KU-BSD001]|uniref:YpmS family protein n=1 Tax=Lysinibacillus sp. KU-BSD001 TaxID=3141328 RepID=UPI0036ECFCA9
MWKVAFFTLAGAVILSIAAIFYLATSPAEDVEKPEPAQTEGNVITVQTTAQEFESITKQYLGEALNKSPLPVEIEVNTQIQVFSTLTVFSVDVPIVMDFEPIVEEGNIVLKQTAVNVGKLNIPPQTVLKLMKDAVDFPSWITIIPNDEEIFVDLSRINIASGSRVRAKEIDLKKDHIVLEVIVPSE